MTRLPAVLSTADLPLAELTAARLDGDLVGLLSAFCPIDELSGPAHRAAALHAGFSERFILERDSAAWVWGARATAPTPTEFCVSLNARARPTPRPWFTVREVVISADEFVELDGVLVTTPLRTALDLLRGDRALTATDRRTIRTVLALGGVDLSDCVAVLRERRNLPYRERALRRAQHCAVEAAAEGSVADQPLLTR